MFTRARISTPTATAPRPPLGASPLGVFPEARRPAGARAPQRLALIAMLSALCGCGFGTIGTSLGLGGSGGGGGGGTPSAISGFEASNVKASPATIDFSLRDEENDVATVAFYYRFVDAGGDTVERLMQELDLPTNPIALQASNQGEPQSVSWDFASEVGLTDGSEFQPDVTVFAIVPGVQEGVSIGVNADAIGLGNDAPEVLEITVPQGEVDGVVGIPFVVADSSSDPVDVRIEFDRLDDVPDAGFQLATPQFFTGPPPFALTNQATDPDGVSHGFAWNTDVDLAEAEGDVRLRFTAVDDSMVESAPLLSDILRVDNNTQAIVVLDNAALLANDDERRGIGVPFRILDPESDAVRMIFQWRQPNDPPFPSLPSSLADLETLLADPAASAQARIARPFPLTARGELVPAGPDAVRLPDLGGRASVFATLDLDGAAFDVLRRSQRPTPLAGTWPGTPLNQPTAVLQLDAAGTRALLLDSDAGGWRLRSIQLLDGTAELIATGTGAPGAMAFEPTLDELDPQPKSVVIASGAGDWRISRVQLDSGVVDTLYVRADPLPAGNPRAIVAPSRGGALVTVSGALVTVDYRAGVIESAAVLRDGLAEPWGLALDPRDHGRVLLAEAGFEPEPGQIDGRLAWVDTHTGNFVSIPTALPNGSPTPATLRQPRTLALDPEGVRVLVWAESSDAPGVRSVFELELGALGANEASSLGEFGGNVSGLDYGTSNTRMVAWTSAGELAVGGGARERLTIADFDPETLTATFAETPGSDLQSGDPWRIELVGPRTFQSSPSGARGVFVWDSSQITLNGGVLFRATPFDTEVGFAAQTSVAKDVRAAIDVDGIIVDGSSTPTTMQTVAIVNTDIDVDGDNDLIAAYAFGLQPLEVYFQTAPRAFEPGPDDTFDAEAALLQLTDMVGGDINGDGDVDIALADQGTGFFGILRQTGSDNFIAGPDDMLDGADTPDPIAVALTDLDRDGDLDLLGTHADGTSVFLQDSMSVLQDTELLVGGSARPTALDVDSDGLLDVVCGNLANGPLLLFRQTALGVFDTTAESLSPSLGFEVREIEVADLDLDGGLDFLLSGPSRFATLLMGPDGQFSQGSTPLALPPSPGGFEPGAMDATDFNGDGRPDAAVAGISARRAGIWAGDGSNLVDPALTLGPGTVIGTAQTGSSAVTACDIDGDGFKDLVNGVGGGLETFGADSPGRFEATDETSYSNLIAGSLPRQVADGDLDRDGDLDLVTTNTGGTPRVLTQSTPGTFETGALPTTSTAAASSTVALGDVDGDGSLDVATADGSVVSVYLNSHAGFDSSATIVLDDDTLFAIDASNAGQFLEFGDADDDGDLDLGVSNSTAASIVVLTNADSPVSPTATFETETAIVLSDAATLDEPRQLRFGDVNDNGVTDIVAADIGSEALVVFPGGAGGPGAAGSFQIGSPLAYLVAIADLDGDGFNDLVSNGPAGSAVRVHYGLAAGAFEPNAEIAIEDAPGGAFTRAIDVADADSDGDLDLAVALDGTVALRFQRAPRRFRAGEEALLSGTGTPAPPFSESLRLLDLDGDGDTDVLAGQLGVARLVARFGAH